MWNISEVSGRILLFLVSWAVLPPVIYGVPIPLVILNRTRGRRKKRHDRQPASRFPYRLVACLLWRLRPVVWLRG